MSSHVKILNCNCNRMIHNVAEKSQAKDKCSWIVEYVLGTSSLQPSSALVKHVQYHRSRYMEETE